MPHLAGKVGEPARHHFQSHLEEGVDIVLNGQRLILGVLPLVLATGAGAAARKSIGIAVFSGMIASTCLAVLFVPAFFVMVQRFEEWLAARKRPVAAANAAQ